ncbi:Hypothetical protein D9617_19g101910 [Elsinoe fawcettii]|nr:Hypothetical protein D9617_19g101910 [Elsinoe fawcettii]
MWMHLADLGRLRLSTTHVNISISPDQLTPLDIIWTVLMLLIRSVLGVFTARKADPLLDNGERVTRPQLSLSLPLRIRPNHYQDYAKAIGRSASDMSPEKLRRHIATHEAHLAMFLGSLCQPSIPLLLARKGCPIRPLGAVNVSNRIELIDVDACRQFVSDGVHDNAAVGPTYRILASLPAFSTVVKRGLQTDVVVSIIGKSSTGLSDASSEEEIFRLVFTMLEFRAQTRHRERLPESGKPGNDSGLNGANLVSNGPFSMSGSDPATWARICKDYNFIHFSGLIARLFGMKARIAHGNHVVAKAIDRLDALEIARSRASHTKAMSRLTIRFKQPVPIPSRLVVLQHGDAGRPTERYSIAVEGSLRPIIDIDIDALDSKT